MCPLHPVDRSDHERDVIAVSDAELAKLDGIVTAVLAGRLHRVALSGLAAAGVDPLEV